MKKVFAATLLAALVAALPSARAEIPDPPAYVQMDFKFSGLNEDTLNQLTSQGALIIVRQAPDLSLINVTAGRIVDAPSDVVWNTIIDFDSYPKFMDQTDEQKIIERDGDNKLLVEQVIALKIWKLPSLDITYHLAQQLSPPNKVRFWHVTGDLQGTYGGWDIVPADNQTMIFYTLYSNLTALPYGLGGIFKAEPDFMAGINVTTAMVVTRCMKQECERRAKP